MPLFVRLVWLGLYPHFGECSLPNLHGLHRSDGAYALVDMVLPPLVDWLRANPLREEGPCGLAPVQSTPLALCMEKGNPQQHSSTASTTSLRSGPTLFTVRGPGRPIAQDSAAPAVFRRPEPGEHVSTCGVGPQLVVRELGNESVDKELANGRKRVLLVEMEDAVPFVVKVFTFGSFARAGDGAADAALDDAVYKDAMCPLTGRVPVVAGADLRNDRRAQKQAFLRRFEHVQQGF